jgi:hypothetical protein
MTIFYTAGTAVMQVVEHPLLAIPYIMKANRRLKRYRMETTADGKWESLK